MQLPVHNTAGEVVGNAEGSDTVFGVAYNPDLMHQALVYYSANQRQGSSNTLRRGEVSGGGRKPFAQKGTGRARQGSTRASIQRHGGVAFGPHPRSYRQRMPKRMRQLALRTALSAKLTNERLRVVKDLDAVDLKTKVLAVVMQAVGVTSSALVVTKGQTPELAKAVRNLPRIKTIRADLLNVLDLLRYDMVLMTNDAVEQANELWSQTARQPRKARPAPLKPAVAKAEEVA
ncbi:MAG: 50S ribosomal protein L4 [Chloroflexi bacterium]|nr:50S ribosomal protein L4 [Chloroflexota bacterium]